MIGSIFRLDNIHRDQDGIPTVRMKLCSFHEHHLKALFQHKQKKTKSGTIDLLDLAEILSDMGKWDDGEKYYHNFLNESSHYSHQSIARCYHNLGSVANEKVDYESSLSWYNKSLETK
jgi:hypothetical protein